MIEINLKETDDTLIKDFYFDIKKTSSFQDLINYCLNFHKSIKTDKFRLNRKLYELKNTESNLYDFLKSRLTVMEFQDLEDNIITLYVNDYIPTPIILNGFTDLYKEMEML